MCCSLFLYSTYFLMFVSVFCLSYLWSDVSSLWPVSILVVCFFAFSIHSMVVSGSLDRWWVIYNHPIDSIYHLTPIKGTRKLHWSIVCKKCSGQLLDWTASLSFGQLGCSLPPRFHRWRSPIDSWFSADSAVRRFAWPAKNKCRFLQTE